MKTITLLRRIKQLTVMSALMALPFAGQVAAQGAGSALRFPATTANEHVNLTTGLSTALATSNFTIELWVNFGALNSDEPIIANKDWNNGANIGFALTRSSKQTASNANIVAPITTNTLWFNMTPTSGGVRRDWHFSLPNLNLLNHWNHVAITADRSGNISFYINGLPAVIAGYTQNGSNSWAAITTSIAADAGKSIAGTLPVRLGQDGTGTYSPRFNGKVDEVRIWTSARTQAQIRENMCQKLAGTESNLLAYYRLDETSGTTAANSATATGATYNATLTNTPTRVASGAAIGDTAVSLYPASFTGQVLSLASPANGALTLQNMSNTLKGIQLYRINAVPNTTTNIPNPGTNNVHYGVFPVDTNATAGSYDLVYNYTNFPDANTFESGIDLYRRFSADSSWNASSAVKNTSANTLTLSAINKRGDLIVGNFFNTVTCNVPTAGAVQNVAYNTATATWATGGSNRWNLEYKAGTFTPGTGIRATNLATSTYNFTGLAANTTYTFYVQDTCSSINSSSSWAGPYTFTTLQDLGGLGSGYAMNFPGTAANEHVNLGTALSGALATSNFTLETWINFAKFNDDESFIANKNWNSGANTGFCWSLSNKSGMPESSLWFNLQPVGGTRRDWHVTIPGLNLKNNWNHVAATVDRKGDVAFYINGIRAQILQYYVGNSLQGTVSTNIAADSAKTINGTLPIRIGQDGTGAYGVKFSGKMDETRVWNAVRTQTEIRDQMCRKLKGTEANLLAYYKMDEPAGTTTANRSVANAALYTGTLVNAPTRVFSGAAVGDTSVYVYGNGLAGTSIQLASLQYGKAVVDSLAGAYGGVQLYRIDTIPNTTFDIASTGNNKVYFGVFPIDTVATDNSNYAVPDAKYRLSYDYAGYANAIANSANLHLYNRKAGDAIRWTDLGAANQPAANKLTIAEQRNRKEIILGDFAAAACANVTNMRMDSLMGTYARIKWTSNASKWNVQYGVKDFTLGQGRIDTVNAAQDVLTGLTGDTWYDVYVRTRCGNDSSKWVGPYTFKTQEQCPAPTSLQGTHLGADSVRLSWNNTGAAVYNLQWGLQGFAFGTGIPVDNITGTSYVLNGLSNTAIYEAYLQDTCSTGGKSKWYGPVVFTATGFVPAPTSVGTLSGEAAVFTVYPNPAVSQLTVDRIQNNGNEKASLILTNIQGVPVKNALNVHLPYKMNLSNLPAGVYLLKCHAGEEINNIRIIISQ